MKKYFLPAVAICALASLASCSSEDQPAVETDGNVTIKLRLPGGMASRATFGDESTVTLNNLQWTVFEVGADNALTLVYSDQKTAFSSSQTEESVSLPLAKGKTYQVAFYADDSSNGFVTYADGAISVDYSKAASNTVAEDAFIGKSSVFTVTGGASETVTLTRPFAQLNWGTDDLGAKSLAEVLKTLTATVSVSSGLYTSMDVISGDVSGEVSDKVEFAPVKFTELPAEDFPTVPGETTYALIAMNYLLTGDGTIDCTLTLTDGLDAVVVNSAPVQVNHRTNIYGSLLTAPRDFNILVDNKFDEPDNNNAVIATTAAAFVSGIAAGKNVEVPEEAEIDLTQEGEIALADNQKLTIKGTVKTARAQIGVSGEGNVAYVEGPGVIESVGLEDGRGSRPLNAYDGGTLVVSNITVNTQQNNGGSNIYSEDGHLVLNNVKTEECHNFAVGAYGGTVVATGCEFNSDSNNKEGAHSYTFGVFDGCKAVLTDCTVNGIQGGVTVDGEGSEVTIKSGVYTTRPLEGAVGQTAFYPVYACTDGVAIIEGGEFISGCSYSVYLGNNDTPAYPYGKATIKGGKFNTVTRNQETKAEIPVAEGYVWEEITDGVFKFQVVPATAQP